ncbi:ras-domain-containing protein, partial [Aureobasidium melanogenum]
MPLASIVLKAERELLGNITSSFLAQVVTFCNHPAEPCANSFPGGVGKSCLTAQFVQGIWIERYDPTIEDSYRKQCDVDGRQVILEILDTAGTEQFTAMRELYMKSGQGFLLVFSITSSSSLKELSELRDQLVNLKDDPHVPIVLVGNKSDLEEDRAVSRAAAFAVSSGWGNVPYYEASARTRQNVTEVFVD